MEIIPRLDLNTVDGKEKKEKIVRILIVMFRNETIIQKVVEWEHANSILNMTIKSISFNKKQIKET